MTLTIERANLLNDYLSEDAERTKALFNLMPEEAVSKINSDGYDFTIEEIKDYGENLQNTFKKTENGEVDINALDNVSGGLATAAALAIYGATAAAGLGVGVCAWNRWW